MKGEKKILVIATIYCVTPSRVRTTYAIPLSVKRNQKSDKKEKTKTKGTYLNKCTLSALLAASSTHMTKPER